METAASNSMPLRGAPLRGLSVPGRPVVASFWARVSGVRRVAGLSGISLLSSKQGRSRLRGWPRSMPCGALLCSGSSARTVPAKSLAEMLSGKGTILNTASIIIADQFEHVEWEGLSFYDLILPLFIFVTGVAIVFSLTRILEHASKFAAHWRVLRRSVLLYALGLIYYGVNEGWPDIRLLGVLNRIALCYLFASLLFLNLRLSGLMVAAVAILLGYWALMTFVPVPEIGVGSYAKDANLAKWIDAQYLPGRKWNGDWDPEGLLSTLPAIGTCLIGVFAGLLLKGPNLQPHEKTFWLLGAGAAMIALGVLWGLQFPIVKNIWTSSYVLVCGGLSALMLGAFHQVIDAWGRNSWATIFIWIGASAITLYLINGLVGFQPLAIKLIDESISNFLNSHLAAGAGRLLAHVVGLLLAVALGCRESISANKMRQGCVPRLIQA
jgi:predicted acyltransferase